MSSWSMEFKRKMMQLHRAFLDPETGKIYKQEAPCEIHSNCMTRMNEDRRAHDLPVLSVPEGIDYDDWECRGYVHKQTGKFMSANDAVEWAEPNMNGCDWDGEGNRLQRLQERMATE